MLPTMPARRKGAPVRNGFIVTEHRLCRTGLRYQDDGRVGTPRGRRCRTCPDEITEVISRLPDGGGTPREPQLPPLAAMAAEQRIADELRNQALLEYLKHVPCNERANGRPLKTLPKEIARLVLADVDAGFTLSAIVRRYREVIPFSRCWLAEVIRNGRLRKMAGM